MGVRVINIPNAKESYNEVISTALANVVAKIDEAKTKGETHCYIVVSGGKLPVEAIQTLLDVGYDISYKKFYKGDWFIKAYWEESKVSGGKLFCEKDSGFNMVEVSIEDYKIA